MSMTKLWGNDNFSKHSPNRPRFFGICVTQPRMKFACDERMWSREQKVLKKDFQSFILKILKFMFRALVSNTSTFTPAFT